MADDRYPLSPRIRLLRAMRAKLPGAPSEPPPARPPAPDERTPGQSAACWSAIEVALCALSSSQKIRRTTGRESSLGTSGQCRRQSLEYAMRLSVFAVVLLIATAAPTLAGTVMTSEASTPKISGKVVLYIEPDRLRVETSDYVSIFRADQNTAYLLKPADRKFVRLTSEQLKQLADAPTLLRETLKSMSPEQRARFDEHLKSLPPAQRAGVERIIAGQAAKFEFRDTGATASFGKWSCRQIDKLVDGQPHESLCVVRTSDLGLTEDDVGSLQRFNDFMGQGLPQELGAFSTVDRRAFEKLVGYAAHPVHTEIPTANMQMTLENVEKKPLSPDLFEIPAGYEEDSKLATH